jgi:protein TonB
MPHVDEGQLHAYLDGELPAIGGDVGELERHLAGCGECRAALAEARRIHARASALLRAASPPETIVPPFAAVIGRALGPRGSATHDEEEPTMTNTMTADFAKPRFNHLVASGGQRRRSWNARTAAMSLVVHSALIFGAVYATVKTHEMKKAEELVEFIDVQEKAPPPPRPDEPPPPPPAPAATQALTAPTEPPTAIPAVDLTARAITEQDVSGIGKVAPEAAPPPAVVEAPPAADFAYELAVLDRQPSLSNKGTIASVMERLYPRLLQDAGIGGTVQLQFVIEPDGSVDMGSVKVIESSNDQLSEASIKAVEKFRFRPGVYKGAPVRVLIQMPITWQPAG